MRNCAGRKFLFLLLVFAALPAWLFSACDDATCPPCQGGGGGDETLDLSGMVIDLFTYQPVAGATVELIDGSISTTSGADGSWTLAGLPADADDPLIRISQGEFDSYNSFPISLGVTQYDLGVVSPDMFTLMVMGFGLNPQTASLILGMVVGFDSIDYPQQQTFLADAVVTVTPPTPATSGPVYLDAAGNPNPALTATSESGAFLAFVPDATAVTSVSVSGTRPGSNLVGPATNPVFPGAFVLTGLIDINYTPAP
ncbi:MAG: hypothetical protein AB1640_12470 [bacterium]